MRADPSIEFADLPRSCISDEYDERKSWTREGVVVLMFGVASSVFTTYVLALLGFYV